MGSASFRGFSFAGRKPIVLDLLEMLDWPVACHHSGIYSGRDKPKLEILV